MGHRHHRRAQGGGGHALDPDNERNLRWFAGALGHAAQDPVGRALAQLAGRGRLSGVEDHGCNGISGSVDRHPVHLGPPEWLGMAGRDDLGVTVGVKVDARPIGYITVGDDVRADARSGVDRLRSLGVETVLLSDDTERNTRHLADACGIARWHAAVDGTSLAGLVADYRARARGRPVAVASRNGASAGDLRIDVEAGDLRLTDLDVNRIAEAFAISHRVARVRRRTRALGLGATALGGAVAGAGLAGLPVVAAGALLGTLVVLAVAARG
ncbi:HAD family hydrolase [Nocardioides nitrophenolicus]|uniref:HAD family hydrolase n=1 Tax=Nocardioides nitrophenolicus TaxID=60489 RepID=UPI00195D71F5|nr:HAD family hydrolase [Nocardioides nitrophenolicus]MBM7516295.1 cation transport ATPase [Nocardioides nitrophenolicus]